jgi:ferrous iron transport protein B
MATRTLKSPKDRIATILSIPFMSCGAKLPVYVLLAGAFFPKNPGNAVMAIYATGVLLSLISTLVLRKTVLRGATTPFVMELPPYRLPTLRGLLWHVRDKTWQYTKKAGTVILGASLLIWVLTNFPSLPDRIPESGPTDQATFAVADRTQAEARLEYSFAGRIGKFIEPAVAPLGFTWKIGVASLTGFAAKELVVSTLGILYGVGEGSAEGDASSAEGEGLRQALRDDPALNPLVAAVLMLVILIMPPCFAALATLRAEAGWKWLGFELVYGFGLAWIAGYALHTVGSILFPGLG